MSNDWMLTQSRRKVWPLDVKPEDVNLVDIAKSLSKQCRYGGHVDEFYSVAEHSIIISLALERDGFGKDIQLIGLHHDSAETYIRDIISPLKRQISDFVKPIEDHIDQIISERFLLPWPWPAVIHEYDLRIVRDEKEQLKHQTNGEEWEGYGIPEKGLGILLPCWDHKKACEMFLARHYELYTF